MPAPTKFPDWATDGSNVVEPPDGKKAAGWVPAEQPPSGWFNWWQRNVGEWTRWFDDRVNDLLGRVSAIEPVSADAARKSQQNTFTKSQIINTESNWADDPLLTTTGKPADDPTDISPAPAGSNRWKLILRAPTQGTAWAGIFVGQSPYGAALVNNARWHIATQRWRQLDANYPSTAMVGRSGQWVASFVPDHAAPWADWPNDAGGDFIAGGNISARGQFLYQGTHVRSDFTIPLSRSSGETFLQADGSYKVGPDGGSWPLNLPDGTVLSDIYIQVEHASSGGGASLGALVRRDKGVIGLLDPSVLPVQQTLWSANAGSGAGVKYVYLASAGHVFEASWEYSVTWRRSQVDDKIARISLVTLTEQMLQYNG